MIKTYLLNSERENVTILWTGLSGEPRPGHGTLYILNKSFLNESAHKWFACAQFIVIKQHVEDSGSRWLKRWCLKGDRTKFKSGLWIAVKCLRTACLIFLKLEFPHLQVEWRKSCVIGLLAYTRLIDISFYYNYCKTKCLPYRDTGHLFIGCLLHLRLYARP